MSSQFQQQTKTDLDRLVELCNSYGLNQQQTKQIISDFQNGSFVCEANNESSAVDLDESFQQSLQSLDSYRNSSMNKMAVNRLNVSKSKNQCEDQEEYSFKNLQNRQDSQSYGYMQHFDRQQHYRDKPTIDLEKANNNMKHRFNKEHYDSLQDSCDNQPLHRRQQISQQKYAKIDRNNYKEIHGPKTSLQERRQSVQASNANQSSQSIHANILQEMFTPLLQKFEELHKSVQNKFEEENLMLREQLQEKEKRIEFLLEAKKKDDELIKGNKQHINDLTRLLEQKDNDYRTLFQRYDKLVQQITYKRDSGSRKSLGNIGKAPKDHQISGDNFGEYEISQESEQKQIAQIYKGRGLQNSLNPSHSGFQKNNSQKNLSKDNFFDERNNVKDENLGCKTSLKYSQNRSSRTNLKTEGAQLRQIDQNIDNMNKSQSQSNFQKSANTKSQLKMHNNQHRRIPSKHKEQSMNNYHKHLENSKRVDISKYKGMIQKLRSSYEIR